MSPFQRRHISQEDCLGSSRGVLLHLRITGAGVGIGAKGVGIGAKVGLLGSGAAGPVFLHVGTTFVEPTVVGYDPTEGGTTDP